VSWIPDHPGVYELHVSLDNTPLKGSPFTVKAHGASVPDNSPIEISHEIKVSLKIQTYDKRHDAQSRGGDNIKIVVTGKKDGVLPFEAKDNNDGTYTLTFMASSQEYRIEATLDGKQCKGSPFNFIVPAFEKHQG